MSSAVSVKVATNIGGKQHRSAVGSSKETPVMTSAGDFNMKSEFVRYVEQTILADGCAHALHSFTGVGPPQPVPSMIREAQRRFHADSTVNTKAR